MWHFFTPVQKELYLKRRIFKSPFIVWIKVQLKACLNQLTIKRRRLHVEDEAVVVVAMRAINPLDVSGGVLVMHRRCRILWETPLVASLAYLKQLAVVNDYKYHNMTNDSLPHRDTALRSRRGT